MLDGLLAGKDEATRAHIAARVGERLCVDDMPEVERKAAESLARELASDAMERVRMALATAVRHARHLPRDIALKIAHDLDSIACPFLEYTEVFTDRDWQQLVLTLSRGALSAVARRTSISEGLAQSLASLGTSSVAETLIENVAAPMTEPVCDTLMDRFDSSPWVLDKLAAREDLIAAIALKLTTRVSEAARRKLAERYNLGKHATPLAAEVDGEALLRLIGATQEAQLPVLARSLKAEGKLTPALVRAALRGKNFAFFHEGLAALSGVSSKEARQTVLRGSAGSVLQLVRRAGLPAASYDELWNHVTIARRQRSGIAIH